MNDGAVNNHQFGLDGEGPGPAEQRAWSWNTPYPPLPTGQGPSAECVPGQPPPSLTQPFGSYGYTPGFTHLCQSGPAFGQDPSNAHRPQRRVHFNDQLSQQPSGYKASSQPYDGRTLTTNIDGQWQERGYPQQSVNYGRPARSEFHHQVPSHGPVLDSYADPLLFHGGMRNPQAHDGGSSVDADRSYPPPMPSYRPVGYGLPVYTGWLPTAHHSAYGQPSWPGQSMQGPTYLTPPNQPSHPYPYPQSTYPSGPVAPVPPLASMHPGGGTWGPPPSKPVFQDSAKDDNNQLEGQGNQQQDSTSNVDGQPNDNNTQGWGNDDANKTQAGDSGWNSNDTGGVQTDSWNNTSQAEAPTNDWNQSATETGQTNNVDASWNTNANTSTQGQDPWNTGPAIAQPDEATFTSPQQAPTTATLDSGRSLYGPHGPYYDRPDTSPGLPADAGEEPPYDIPADVGTTHQVKSGQGYMYVHKRRSPEYLDTLEEPYARFVFKYRTKGESS